jgi:uncharacterized protein (DUF58 family)
VTSPIAAADTYKTGCGIRFGFAMGPRFFLLLAAGLVLVPFMFMNEAVRWLLLAWNVVVVLGFLAELRRLPRPHEIAAARTHAGLFKQLQSIEIALAFRTSAVARLYLHVEDAVPNDFEADAREFDLIGDGAREARVVYSVVPQRRGSHRFGSVFLRYETSLRLAQRWAVFDLEEDVLVLPNLAHGEQRQAFLMRSRQIQLQQRTLRMRGQGREFESLREFQSGDELRSICWTATARRSRLVVTQRQIERSQTIWTIVDCGRLMRARVGPRAKLDYATEAAVALAQVADYGGDSSALLAYGQQIQQRRLPGRGSPHLHALLNQAALQREEAYEADHLLAASSLMMLQKSRAMVVWITDLADLAITPEVVTAALMAAKRHLVVVAVIGQPDVTRLTARAPKDTSEAFLYAAASELTGRRELALAQLRARGVRAIEINAPQLTGAILNQYLEIKQKNLL